MSANLVSGEGRRRRLRADTNGPAVFIRIPGKFRGPLRVGTDVLRRFWQRRCGYAHGRAPLMIEVRGLTKRYGSTLAVDDLSFDVLPGRVTGFLGPNGAGKSTTMRMILGLDHPSSGTVRVLGKPYAQCRRPLYEVGAVLESRAVHGDAARSTTCSASRRATASGAPGSRRRSPSSDCRMWDADEPVACRSA